MTFGEVQVEIVNLADIPDKEGRGSMGCGCATMSRNDPPHLVAMLDLLKKGAPPDINHVLPGDVVDEHSGWRERLESQSRQRIIHYARQALTRMIEITEAKP
jgi:quinolinate synthase